MKIQIIEPTEEQKNMADGACNQIIEQLNYYPLEIKALVLHTLVESFKDACKSEGFEIKINEVKGEGRE